MHEAERTDTREELNLVDNRDKEEDGRDEREEALCERLALQYLGHIHKRALKCPLHTRLEPTGDKRERPAEKISEANEERHHNPRHNERICNGETENGAQLLRLENDFNA